MTLRFFIFSLLTSICSILFFYIFGLAGEDRAIWIPAFLWAASIGSFILAIISLPNKQIEKTNINFRPTSFFEILVLISIIFFGFFLRIYRIQMFPPLPDEELWISLLESFRNFHPVGPHGYIGDQPSNFQILFIWPIYEIFRGDPLVGLRLFGVILSLITTINLYFICKKLFSYKEGLIAAALFSVALWDINNSRFGGRYIHHSVSPLTTGIFLSLLNLKERNSYDIAICLGVLLGILVNLLYLPCVILPGVGLLLLYLYKSNKVSSGPILSVIALASIIALPTILKIFAENPLIRHKQKLYMADVLGTKVGYLQYLSRQASFIVDGFFNGWPNFEYGSWNFNIPLSIQLLCLFGLLSLIFELNKFGVKVFWLLTSSLVLVYFIIPEDAGYRYLFILPFITIACSHGIVRIDNLLSKMAFYPFKIYSAKPRKIFSLVIFFAISIVISNDYYLGWQKYVRMFIDSGPDVDEMACQNALLADSSNETKSTVIIEENSSCMPLVNFFAPSHQLTIKLAYSKQELYAHAEANINNLEENIIIFTMAGQIESNSTNIAAEVSPTLALTYQHKEFFSGELKSFQVSTLVKKIT